MLNTLKAACQCNKQNVLLTLPQSMLCATAQKAVACYLDPALQLLVLQDDVRVPGHPKHIFNTFNGCLPVGYLAFPAKP